MFFRCVICYCMCVRSWAAGPRQKGAFHKGAIQRGTSLLPHFFSCTYLYCWVLFKTFSPAQQTQHCPTDILNLDITLAPNHHLGPPPVMRAGCFFQILAASPPYDGSPPATLCSWSCRRTHQYNLAQYGFFKLRVLFFLGAACSFFSHIDLNGEQMKSACTFNFGM